MGRFSPVYWLGRLYVLHLTNILHNLKNFLKIYVFKTIIIKYIVKLPLEITYFTKKPLTKSANMIGIW